MANLLSYRSFAVASYVRSRAHEQRVTTFHAGISLAVRRAEGPRLQAASREQRSFVSLNTRSIPVSGPGSPSVSNASGGVAGQVTAELMNSMRTKICQALETDACTVTDVYGDGRHVSIDVVSKLFVDKNTMQRQRMVYKAIWMELQEAVHAVDSMNTKTPEEAT